MGRRPAFLLAACLALTSVAQALGAPEADRAPDQSVDVWQRPGQKTVFARERLTAGQSVIFVSVLVPHESEVKARPLAEGIAVLEEADATIVRVASPTTAGKLSVTIGRDDAWRVERRD